MKLFIYAVLSDKTMIGLIHTMENICSTCLPVHDNDIASNTRQASAD